MLNLQILRLSKCSDKFSLQCDWQNLNLIHYGQRGSSIRVRFFVNCREVIPNLCTRGGFGFDMDFSRNVTWLHSGGFPGVITEEVSWKTSHSESNALGRKCMLTLCWRLLLRHGWKQRISNEYSIFHSASPILTIVVPHWKHVFDSLRLKLITTVILWWGFIDQQIKL